MYKIGINAVFHDSSACILKDGVLLAAAEEERFTHVKHTKRPIPFSTYKLPFYAIIILFLSVYWRIYGAIKFRVFFI